MAHTLLKPYTDQQKIDFLVQYNDVLGLRIAETDAALYALEENEIMQDDVPIIDPDYEAKQQEARKQAFESAFMETSYKKGSVTGWYRQQPKGYSNAPQSIDVINNIVNMLGSLTEQVAEMVVFYKQPNYKYKNQCTEEWLIAHSFNPNPMTLEEWQEFYIDFQTRWSLEHYVKDTAE